ncbi:hypothetical protein BX666DRAFT_1887432 [Dichotomocladium elegans]|nr:hypothetical protein BX666DRAFT_1887432 [Dichotomocladium elegans]
MEGLELCYLNDPADPVFISKQKLFCNRFRYHCYSTEDSTCIDRRSTPDPVLLSAEMVKDFLNEVFLRENPFAGAYYLKTRMVEIQATVARYTTMFDDKISTYFARWCTRNKLDLSQGAMAREISKAGDGGKIRCRILRRCQGIKKYFPQYHKHLKEMKKDGYAVIGYCRTSRTIEGEETRVRLLQMVVNCIRTRSLADHAFVSPFSAAGDEICTRDFNNKFNMKSVQDIADMISFLAVTPKFSLVVLDVAGLTANTKDLKQFIINTPHLENIIIDQVPRHHQIRIFSREHLLNGDHSVALFDCRVACVQRAR